MSLSGTEIDIGTKGRLAGLRRLPRRRPRSSAGCSLAKSGVLRRFGRFNEFTRQTAPMGTSRSSGTRRSQPPPATVPDLGTAKRPGRGQAAARPRNGDQPSAAGRNKEQQKCRSAAQSRVSPQVRRPVVNVLPPLRHLRFRAGALRFSPQVVPVVHIWCTSHTEPFVDRGRARSSSAKRWRSARAPSPEMVMSSVTDKAH